MNPDLLGTIAVSIVSLTLGIVFVVLPFARGRMHFPDHVRMLLTLLFAVLFGLLSTAASMTGGQSQQVLFGTAVVIGTIVLLNAQVLWRSSRS